MLASLMALAVLEHWLLVVPLPVDAFWQWGIQQTAPAEGLSLNKDSQDIDSYETTGTHSDFCADDFASDYEHPPTRARARRRSLAVLMQEENPERADLSRSGGCTVQENEGKRRVLTTRHRAFDGRAE